MSRSTWERKFQLPIIPMGASRDLTFFRLTPGGQTPRPILMQNGSNDVDTGKDDAFGVQFATVHVP